MTEFSPKELKSDHRFEDHQSNQYFDEEEDSHPPMHKVFTRDLPPLSQFNDLVTREINKSQDFPRK